MFRWKRALLHGLIPLGLVMAGGMVLLFATDPANPEKAGEGIGRFAACAYLAGLGISYLVQTGRRTAAVVTSLALLAGVAGLIAVLVISAPNHRFRPLSGADKAPLVAVEVAGELRLRHPTLGFTILRPPASYVDAPRFAAMMVGHGDDAGNAYYAYAETPPTAALIVGVMNDAGESRTAFREMLDGVRRGLQHSVDANLGSAAKVEYVRDEITGDDAHLEGHLHATYAGRHMQLNAYALHPAGRPPAIVSVMVIAPDPALLADVLTSFRP